MVVERNIRNNPAAKSVNIGFWSYSESDAMHVSFPYFQSDCSVFKQIGVLILFYDSLYQIVIIRITIILNRFGHITCWGMIMTSDQRPCAWKSCIFCNNVFLQTNQSLNNFEY